MPRTTPITQSVMPFFGSVSVSVREGSSAGTFKIEVDGDPPALLWIKWYWTADPTIPEPTLVETPYQDTAGTLQVDCLHSPSFSFTTADINLPTNARWVLAVAWGLHANNPSLYNNSGKHDFGSGTSSTTPTTTTTTTTSSTSSSTTTSTTTGTSSTSSTTSGSKAMATWVWQSTKSGGKWALTDDLPDGYTAQEPKVKGRKPGDTAQTPLS